jgi:hypothetical protein
MASVVLCPIELGANFKTKTEPSPETRLGNTVLTFPKVSQLVDIYPSIMSSLEIYNQSNSIIKDQFGGYR